MRIQCPPPIIWDEKWKYLTTKENHEKKKLNKYYKMDFKPNSTL